LVKAAGDLRNGRRPFSQDWISLEFALHLLYTDLPPQWKLNLLIQQAHCRTKGQIGAKRSVCDGA
ncbi:MAG TPA: hypothetical protein VKJ45_13700, partial [Blastocatellia bacterium]|nr:hypothetical protein [Blastocatellia bacterium]